jgi:hypothetical protein
MMPGSPQARAFGAVMNRQLNVANASPCQAKPFATSDYAATLDPLTTSPLVPDALADARGQLAIGLAPVDRSQSLLLF